MYAHRPDRRQTRRRSAGASATRWWLAGLFAVLVAGPLRAQAPVVIHPGQPPESSYLVDDHSALREIGYDPLCPFTRIADGRDMWYTYRFAPGRGRAAYLLVSVGSQFLISASADGGKVFTPVADMDRCERVGTRVLVDLSPFLVATDSVLVRFEDKYKEDGWGALTSEILYYTGTAAGPAHLVLDGAWTCSGRRVPAGATIRARRSAAFGTTFAAPSGWPASGTAVYVAGAVGVPASASLNGHALRLQRTWDMGWWADTSGALRPGAVNRLTLTIAPSGGRAGLLGPLRVGPRLPACAVPADKLGGAAGQRPNRQYEPYTPEKMNFLAGNFMQCLFDRRYDLLAFAADERMPIHFVHDTLRSLAALAEEDRYTPVARLDLARRLYRGCKRAILPGGECLFAFKHDRRPVDIRPLAGFPDLTLAHKLDETRLVASVGVSLAGDAATSGAGDRYADTPRVLAAAGTSFTRTWTLGQRRISARAFIPPGDADTPPRFEFSLDGNGPVRIHVGRLVDKGMWMVPGSWGPEAIVLPDGATHWAHAGEFDARAPGYHYLLVRGGNSGQYTFCRALLVLWDAPPSSVVTKRTAGGRHGSLYSDVVLEYANDRPAKVRLIVFPFDGYPEALKAPRAIAENLLRTGRMGVGVFDPVATATSNGLGPGAMAAAAWLFRKYHAPEAAEASDLAERCMRSVTALDEAGTHTEQLYYLIDACRLMADLGHPEYLPWAQRWADRILEMQIPDGSFQWLNFQFRQMVALLRAEEITGDAKYRRAFDKALATIEYRGDALYWKGKLEQYDDFAGAVPFAIFGHLGDAEKARTVLRSREHYVDDRGFFGCSDLNPYMLGFSAAGLRLKQRTKIVLGLDKFAIYDSRAARKVARPTAYVVNPHGPPAAGVSFALPR